MPIVDFETRICSRFRCATTQSASPAQKAAHQMPAVYDVKSPHVKVEAVLSTRGSFVERVDFNFYEGHVPDAPVLLGRSQLDVYDQALKTTGWSKQRLIALGSAACVGAVIGCIAVGCVLGLVALAHLAWPATIAAVSASDVWIGVASWALAGAFMCVLSDWKDWSDSRAFFGSLKKMAQASVQLDAGVRRPVEDASSQTLINEARGSSNFILQQAAMELEAARDRAGMPTPKQAAA